MSYRRVGGDETRTRFTPAPLVTVETVPDRESNLVLEFPFTLRDESGTSRITRVTFRTVFEYQFITTGFGTFRTNTQDRALGLIEIENSQLLADRVSQSRYQPDLHHYRITFDEHGSYEVLCLHINIEQLPPRQWS